MRSTSGTTAHSPRRNTSTAPEAISAAVRSTTTSKTRSTTPALSSEVGSGDEPPALAPAEQDPVVGDRRDIQAGGDDRPQQDGEVEALLSRAQPGEPRAEGHREQESGEDLGAGLRHPQLLEQLVPVPVEHLVEFRSQERVVALVDVLPVDLLRPVGQVPLRHRLRVPVGASPHASTLRDGLSHLFAGRRCG